MTNHLLKNTAVHIDSRSFLKYLSPAWMRRLATGRSVTLRIGIPRMFFYFMYPGLWETFFREIGMEPVLSGPSTVKTVERASQISETEHCLPNKLFDAHLEELLGKVDMVFVPRVLSNIKHHLSCPKFGPLPDAARADIVRGVEVLSIDIDENDKPLSKALLQLGKKLNVPGSRTRAAVKSAISAMNEVNRKRTAANHKKTKPRFLLIGHPYTIHDNFIAGPVLNKLKSMDVEVELISFADGMPEKSYIMWGTANEIYHKINSLASDDYEGIIQITVFNCGCDSMMTDRYRERIKEKGIPYLYLMVDEHQARSGMETRVEAFIDSLRWRK